MCYGENMPLDVLFVRDDDIPDLVQEDVCDLGLVGLNVVEEKRLAFEARAVAPLFEQMQLLDFGHCRLCIAVPDGFAGRLRNDKGEALSGILVTVWPKVFNPGTATHGISSVHTDQSGAFTIGGLAPGEYYVAAWQEIESGLAKNPDFLAAFTGDAAEVRLSESSTASAAVKMIAKDKIAAEASKPR